MNTKEHYLKQDFISKENPIFLLNQDQQDDAVTPSRERTIIELNAVKPSYAYKFLRFFCCISEMPEMKTNLIIRSRKPSDQY